MDIKQELAEKNAAFISGSREEPGRAKCEMQKVVKEAKFRYNSKLEDQFSSNNTRSVWQGMQQIMQHKARAAAINICDPTFSG